MINSGKRVALLDMVTYLIEAAVTVFLLLIVIILLTQTVAGYFGSPFTIIKEDFNSILAGAFTLIIGVEFCKMLYKHSSETVVEVLIFATARQVILSHGDIINTLFGAIAIAGMFAAKKYLIPDKE